MFNSKYIGKEVEQLLDQVSGKTVYTAGDGIAITNGVITCTSGGEYQPKGDYLTSESLQAYYDSEYIDSRLRVISAALHELAGRIGALEDAK